VVVNETTDVFDGGFISQMSAIMTELSAVVADIPLGCKQWVFYGSQPLGVARPDSDLDALLLHESNHVPPHRRSAMWHDVPVTIYVVSWHDLAQDGASRRFGGYFSLKLFSPFITNAPERAAILAGTTARFLAPFSYTLADGWKNSRWTVDQLVAYAHLAFIDLYPDAASYFARLLRDPELFTKVWQYQASVHVDALCEAGEIASDGHGLWRYTGNTTIIDPVRERARCAARFWAFGAVCHDSDMRFPDLYFDKVEAREPRAEQERARRFLRDVIRGREVL
jgi:hypothetical protein